MDKTDLNIRPVARPGSTPVTRSRKWNDIKDKFKAERKIKQMLLN